MSKCILTIKINSKTENVVFTFERRLSAGSGTSNWHCAGDLKVRRGCRGQSQKICMPSAFRFSPGVFSEMRIPSKRGRSESYLARARTLKSPTETEHSEPLDRFDCELF